MVNSLFSSVFFYYYFYFTPLSLSLPLFLAYRYTKQNKLFREDICIRSTKSVRFSICLAIDHSFFTPTHFSVSPSSSFTFSPLPLLFLFHCKVREKTRFDYVKKIQFCQRKKRIKYEISFEGKESVSNKHFRLFTE